YTLCRDYQCPLDVPIDTLVARAVAAAGTALRLDSMSGMAWSAEAYADSMRPYAAGGNGVRAARRAIELDSTDAEAWHFYGWLSLLSGRDSLAADAYRHALRIDPSRAVDYEHLARVANFNRRPGEARALLDT